MILKQSISSEEKAAIKSEILVALHTVIDGSQILQSDDRTEKDRQLAILRTEAEKILAWALYILGTA